MSEKEIKGFCPNCVHPLYYLPSQKQVFCNCCDCEVTPLASLSAEYSAPAAPAVPMAAAPAPAVISFDSAESALIYLENFFETYDWSDFCRRSDYTLYEIKELISTNKAKNGASAHVWYLDFKALSVPLAKKLEALEDYESRIVEKYDPEDNTEVFEVFDQYCKIVNKLSGNREAIFKQLETDVKYAERFTLEEERLEEIRAELDALREAFDKKVRPVHVITDVPAYLDAKNALNEKKRAELLASTGVDAEQVYRSALEAYNPDAIDNNAALALFEQIRGYGDSVEYINRINKYFDYHSQLFHFSGKTFIFRQTAAARPTLNVANPAEGAAADAPEEDTSAQSATLSLYEIVNGEPAGRPVIRGIDQILSCYGTRLYYFKRASSRLFQSEPVPEKKKGCGSKKDEKDDAPKFINADGLYCFNFTTGTEEQLDRSPLSHYQVKDNDYDVRFNRAGNVLMLKKKLPLRIHQEKGGCLSIFKGKPAPEIVAQNNNFSMLSINLRSNAVTMMVEAMVDVADYYEDSLFYVQADEEQKKRGKHAHEESSEPKQNVTTRLMVCNVNTGTSSCVLSEGCRIHNVVDGKIVYSVWTPNDYNNDLRVYNMKTGEDFLIERNALDYRCTLKNYIYYTVGNDTFCPLMRNNFEGTERMEIMERVGNIVAQSGNWLYIQKGFGSNAALFKMSSDGSEMIFICSQYKSFVKITEDYLYYLDVWDNLHIVRPDGKEDRLVAADLEIVNNDVRASVIVASDGIYYVRREPVDDNRVSKSLYRMDLDGHNIRKLVFDIDRMLDYDEQTLYYSKWEDMRYKVTVPAAKKKDVTTHYETYRLQKYFTLSKLTNESTLILTLNAPHGKTSFKKGCSGKQVTEDLVYQEEPIVRAYKRRNMEKAGANSASAISAMQNTALGKLLLGKKDSEVKAAPSSAPVPVHTEKPVKPSLILTLIAALFVGVGFALIGMIISGEFIVALPISGVVLFLLLAMVMLGKFRRGAAAGRPSRVKGSRLFAFIYIFIAVLLVLTTLITLLGGGANNSESDKASRGEITMSLYSTYTVNGGAPAYYQYTPSSSGMYTFASNGEGDPDITIYDSAKRNSEISRDFNAGDFYCETYLNSGTTYYIEVRNSAGYQPFSFWVTK